MGRKRLGGRREKGSIEMVEPVQARSPAKIENSVQQLVWPTDISNNKQKYILSYFFLDILLDIFYSVPNFGIEEALLRISMRRGETTRGRS